MPASESKLDGVQTLKSNGITIIDAHETSSSWNDMTRMCSPLSNATNNNYNNYNYNYNNNNIIIIIIIIIIILLSS